MRLILLGPPGSGKGTQARTLCQRHGLEHLATGDLLRAAVLLHTPLGEQVHRAMEKGLLVGDEVVNGIVAERFDRADRPARFVLDGYPRTVAQAGALDEILAGHKLDLSAVLLLVVDDGEVVRRVSGRWSCPRPGCDATYHVLTHPPRAAGVCDDCGAALAQREDDTERAVVARLAEYHRNTERLIPYYRTRGLLREVDDRGEIETVYNNITRALAR